jgi:hypothetical protein
MEIVDGLCTDRPANGQNWETIKDVTGKRVGSGGGGQ